MSFDLGLEHENEDPAYVQSAIQQLEETYHLVLLTDYFEESLILLKVSEIFRLSLSGDEMKIFRICSACQTKI